MTRRFTCEGCGGTFDSGWSEEEAMKEYKTTFGPHAEQDYGILCDDCYKKFISWAETNAPELKKGNI